MAQTDSASSAAATKIQATVRGKQDRKKVESHISNVIEAMVTGDEAPQFPSSHHEKTPIQDGNLKPLSTKSFYSEVDDTSVEEEVIVVLDDSYTDHTRDVLLAEFVMEAPIEKPLPTPPRPKSAFEAYNEQLKSAAASKPRKVPTAISVDEKPRGGMKKKLSWKGSIDDPAEAASIDDSIAFDEKPKSTSSMSLDSNSSHHIRKGAQGWWGTNTSKVATESQPEPVPEDSMAFVPTESVILPSKAAKAKPRTSEVTIESDDDFLQPNKPVSTSSSLGSSGHIRKGAQGWWGAKGDPNDTNESKPDALVEQPAEVDESNGLKSQPKDTSTSSQLESTKTSDETPKPKPMAKRSSLLAPPAWLNKSASNVVGSDEKDDKPVVKRKRVALPSWLKKAPSEEEADESRPVEKPQIERSPVVLPKWLEKKGVPSAPDLEDSSETPVAKVLPPTRKWKKPEAKTEAPPAETSETLQSLEPKPVTPETSERGSSPPPPASPLSPRVGKNKVVNRYLSKVVKDDETDRQRRMAEIEADRARGRWDGKGYVRDGDDGGDGSRQHKNWKYLQSKEKQTPEEQFDEGAAIKLQAIVRGFMARRRVAKYVDELIEEMMRKLNAAHAEEEAKRKAKEEEERRKKEEEEFRLWQEREEERLKNEEEEIKRRMHDERYGLPLWWMKMIPHKTMDQKEYDTLVKKDKGVTVIDYKSPPRSTERLDVVTEEESEVGDDNNSNLNKILESSARRAQRTVTTSKPKKKPNTMTKGKKKKKKVFGCMDIDSVEPEANVGGNGHQGTTTLSTAKNDNDDGRDDKEDTESEPDPQQESAPPVVTKIWM